MGKAPAFQFYVKDWLSDPQLRLACPATKGIWIDILCYMWDAPERGKLTGKLEKIARMVGASNGDLEGFIAEATELAFCDISVTVCDMTQKSNALLTIINRRMFRENSKRENNRLRQQRFRERQQGKGDDNTEVTPPSPSPSPSPTANNKEPNGSSSEQASSDGSSKPPICPQQEIKKLYHKILPELPQVHEWPRHLQTFLRTRWKEDEKRQNIQWWKDYFSFIHESAFLMGRSDATDFMADLEWIIRPTNMTKILNGRYHGAKGQHLGIQEWLKIRQERGG